LFTVTGSPATLGGSLTLSAFASQSQNYVLAGPATGGAGAAAFRALVAADIPSAANLPLWSNLQNAAAALTLANANYATTFNQTSAVAWTWANTTAAVLATNQSSPIHNFGGTYFGGAAGALAASAVDNWSVQNVLAVPVQLSTTTSITNISETAGNVVTLTLVASTFVAGQLVTLSGFGTGFGDWLNGYTVSLTTATAVTCTFTDPTSHGLLASHATTGTPVMTQVSGLSTLAFTHSGSGINSKVQLPSSAVLEWSTDTGISRLTAGSLAIGNGTAGDVSGKLSAATYLAGNGTSSAPSYSFTNATTAGMFLNSTTPDLRLTDGTNTLVLLAGTGIFVGTAAMLVSSAGLTHLVSGGVYGWGSNSGNPNVALDTGISRLGAASLAIGNGTAGDFSGSLKLKSVLITDTAANADLTVQNTTTATSSTTNASPLLEIAANYWTGSASAVDTWTIGSSLAAGTNGVSSLTFSHSGSSGSAQVLIPNGTTANPALAFSAYPGSGMYNAGNGAVAFSQAGVGYNAFSFDYNGELRCVVGGGLAWTGSATLGSGSPDTGITRAAAGIVAIGTGAQGSIAGSIQASSIALNGAVASPTAGIYYSGTNAGITQSAIAVGTIGTTGGIVTTFTGVSDERLKKFTEYGGGLAEILNIVPIRYRWNEAGQKKSGQTGDRDYVGFSAQNVQRSIPEAIQGTEGEEKYLSFDDRPVIAALVNAVKGLSAKNDALEARLAHLEKIIEKEGA
jgi:hypothetical protein